MEAEVYWIWMQRALGYGARLDRIFPFFSCAEELYQSTDRERRLSGSFTTAQIDKMESVSLDQAQTVLQTCQKNGWKIIPLDSSGYPKRLAELADRPAVLYVQGDLPPVDSLAAVAVVGTRHVSSYGRKVTDLLCGSLARAGALVVSGGALGVDSAAHQAALRAGGKTVAVLGSGLGQDYLKANASLRETISHQGALLTEFQPEIAAAPYTFPLRNRLISGLSVGVVVIEAGLKSGSLITARHAIEQGRDVFAVPGSVMSSAYVGTSQLLRDGAKAVFAPLDVLEEYAQAYSLDLEGAGSWAVPEKTAEAGFSCMPGIEHIDEEKEQNQKREQQVEQLPLLVRKVYDALSEEDQQVDLLCVTLGAGSQMVLSALTQLELLGLAQSSPGRRYRRTTGLEQ